jgi:hypothetical protein
MRLRVLLTHVICLLLVIGSSGVLRADSFRGPWQDSHPEETLSHQPFEAFNPIRTLVMLHRKYVSPVDGKECPMYPSCSEYSLRCFERHGLFMGWVMTCDRLLHEADEMREAPVVYVNGEERFFDPPGNNDFWWHRER